MASTFRTSHGTVTNIADSGAAVEVQVAIINGGVTFDGRGTHSSRTERTRDTPGATGTSPRRTHSGPGGPRDSVQAGHVNGEIRVNSQRVDAGPGPVNIIVSSDGQATVGETAPTSNTARPDHARHAHGRAQQRQQRTERTQQPPLSTDRPRREQRPEDFPGAVVHGDIVDGHVVPTDGGPVITGPGGGSVKLPPNAVVHGRVTFG
jgi:hypothetical protein